MFCGYKSATDYLFTEEKYIKNICPNPDVLSNKIIATLELEFNPRTKCAPAVYKQGIKYNLLLNNAVNGVELIKIRRRRRYYGTKYRPPQGVYERSEKQYR